MARVPDDTSEGQPLLRLAPQHRASTAGHRHRRSKSPRFILLTNVSHSDLVHLKTGPSGFFESPMKIAWLLGATRTQLPPLQPCAMRQRKLSELARSDEVTSYFSFL